ncbi:MAG: hypothetical protein NVS9B3_10500 [Gemmatimonadaceae bacterium]
MIDLAHMSADRRIALVLGGGGLKGFAHIGVLRALAERGLVPALFAGTSIGALIAAAHAGGMSVDEMADRAESLVRRDLFRLNHMGVILERLRASSLYLEEPLRKLAEAVTPLVTFDVLPKRLLVNTVDIERGIPAVWGLAGMRDVPVSDAVYASCALPGFFPPGRVDGRLCVDGGVIDNLPVGIASLGMDAVIAVDVGSSDLTPQTMVAREGFASVYMRSATIMMHALQQLPLSGWQGPPMLLIRPKIGHVHWLSFSNTAEVIGEGYRAAIEALDQAGDWMATGGGVYPRRSVRVTVDRAKCTGCGICAAAAPHVMGLDSSGKAFPRTRVLDWSPADGDFVHQCPTAAIHAEPAGSHVPKPLPVLSRQG